jgi:DNA repair photolyase
MVKRDGLSVSITTKSNQVLRDIDLLKRIAERSRLSVNLSITTLRARLARLLEPRAPRPDLRLEAVRTLREAGISSGVLAMPIVPGITDRTDDLDALARGARDAQAQWFAGNVLFLMPASLKHFLPFLDAKFPKLSRQYREWYGRHGNAPDAYRKEITARVENLRQKYGLGSRPDRGENRSWKSPQMQLGLGINQGGKPCPARDPW